MQLWRSAGMTWAILVFLCAALCGLAGCGQNTPGRMEWIQPLTTATPRVGTVYCIRGWQGVFSWGIDEMSEQLKAQGITAYVFMPEQYPEMAKTMVERYKNSPNHEPICFIGHSRGVDSSIIIARELDQAGVKVDLIVALDSVDEDVVPKNVRECRNYWMPGFLYGTNILRGIPLKAQAGSIGTVYNLRLDSEEGKEFHEPLMNHVDMDKKPKLQKHIVEQCKQVCVERAKWNAQLPPTPGMPAAPATRPAR